MSTSLDECRRQMDHRKASGQLVCPEPSADFEPVDIRQIHVQHDGVGAAWAALMPSSPVAASTTMKPAVCNTRAVEYRVAGLSSTTSIAGGFHSDMGRAPRRRWFVLVFWIGPVADVPDREGHRKVDPTPSSLCMPTLPPSNSAIFLLNDSPSPVPRTLLDRRIDLDEILEKSRRGVPRRCRYRCPRRRSIMHSSSTALRGDADFAVRA